MNFFFSFLRVFYFFDVLSCVYLPISSAWVLKRFVASNIGKCSIYEKYLAFKICGTNFKRQEVLVRALVRKVSFLLNF